MCSLSHDHELPRLGVMDHLGGVIVWKGRAMRSLSHDHRLPRLGVVDDLDGVVVEREGGALVITRP
ncbi:hypothetical protein D3C79_989880 [compost metagenome]